MKFALAVYGAPYSSQAPHTAYNFACSVLQAGHSISRIFFYHAGVLNASSLAVTPQDELDITEQWSKLSRNHDVELAVCIAAALKRGIVNKEEATRYELGQFNLHPAFELVGLGQWVDAMISADRVVVFGK